MFKCIYCEQTRDDRESTLEHTIPQCLGGAAAPDRFKTRQVCRTCNSNLGLFVDASFEKSWFVANWLQSSAMACFDPRTPTSIPLMCMGTSELKLPHMEENEVCEMYVGPLGEPVYWVRPHDEKLYWYSGGNPRTAKSVASRAYFFFSERSHKNPIIPWLSFRDAFAKRKVRKVFGTEVVGANPEDIGFSAADSLDQCRIEYLRSLRERMPAAHVGISLAMDFDLRFLAKLARGVGFCLFGERALIGPYAAEITKALWYRKGEDDPALQGSSSFAERDERFTKFVGLANAVTLFISNTPLGVSLNINLGQRINATVLCAERSALTIEDQGIVGHGLVVVLYPSLNKSVALSLPEFIHHKSGRFPNSAICLIEKSIGQNEGYFRNL